MQQPTADTSRSRRPQRLIKPSRSRPRIETWHASPSRSRPAQLELLTFSQPPPPIEVQEAAIYAELCCWGRERLI